MVAAAAVAVGEIENGRGSLQLRSAVEDTSAEAGESGGGESPRSCDARSCDVVDALEARGEGDDAWGCE